MSLQIEEQFAMDQTVESNDDAKRKPKISYKREFLLSLSELDVCKKLPKLPSGFDELLLRDFEDPVPEHRRVSADFSSHGFRRNDYSSSPPTRGELMSYSRGIHGRWEGRSGGWNDKDSDSQSDRDPAESGRRYGMPSRRPWQAPEHDGLLGKGSFPKPSGYGAGTSGPRFQSNDSYQLNRSNEPYHPPRPYKAIPYSRRDTKDSLNDETFGSFDTTSEDQAEEERKRRASFELLRKEQHKAFQERQKLNPEGRKNDFDITELLEDSKDEKGRPDTGNKTDEPLVLPGSNNTSVLFQNTASRPLVPPGFASTVLERRQGAKPSIGNSQSEGSFLNAKGSHPVSGISGNQEEKQPGNKIGSDELKLESTNVHFPSASTSERTVNLSTVLGISTDIVGNGNSFENVSNISRVTETPRYTEKIEQATEKLEQKKSLGNSDQEDSPSILDKLFNAALNLNGGDSSNFIEQIDSKGEETWSPQTAKSSKFAYLFLEEEKKPLDDISSSRPSGLLSLIQGADQFQSFDVTARDELPSGFPLHGHDTKNSEQSSNTNTSQPAAALPVLTCEDLEQSILSEVSEAYSPPTPAMQDWNISGARTEQQKTNVDDQASKHLLSLLQRGTDPKHQDVELSLNIESRAASEIPPKAGGVSKEADTGSIVDSGKTLTLETLFGRAFMKELQSVGEPVSGRAGVSEAQPLPIHIKDEDLLPSGPLLGPNRSIGELSQRDQIRSDGFPEGLFCSADHRAELGSRISASDKSADVRLPEEDNLLALGDPSNLQKYVPLRGTANREPEVPFSITEKLAALNSGPRNERPLIGGQDGPFLRHPQYMNEPDVQFQHSNVHPSPQQLQPSHLNSSGPAFHSFDLGHANFKSQINFMAPGSVIHQDPPPAQQFPANMVRPPFRHTLGGVPESDRLPHPLLQQMHMQGNLPHPHLLQGFPGGPPHQHPPHVNNQLPGLLPELNATQGFPFGHRQPNYPGHTMTPPVPDVNRSDHPASLQRLLGIDPRIDPKQIPPLGGPAAVPQRQGSFGHELDLGFGYR